MAHQQLLHEAMMMSRLSHPNIAGVRDFGHTEDGRPYMVMEHLSGADLECLMAEEGPIGVDEAILVTKGVLHALQACHQQGIIHRDIKPSNVFLNRSAPKDERVKVIDFGIAQDHSSDKSLYEDPEGQVLGTLYFMAPEQLEGVPPSMASDLYATGLMLYQMIAGDRPFPEINGVGVLAVRASRPFPSLTGFAANDPRMVGIDDCIAMACAPEPSARYSSAAQMLDALLKVV